MWRDVPKDRKTRQCWERFPATKNIPGRVGLFALTFDDGPDIDATPEILAALDDCGAPATFFMVGDQVKLYPDLPAEVAARGHEIALHGYSHRHYPKCQYQEVIADLRRGITIIETITLLTVRRFRPPYGRFSRSVYRECARRRLQPILWSAWGLDWEERSAESIAETVLRDLESGTIVLLHDSPRYAERKTALPTAEAVPLIVAEAKRRGLQPIGLNRLVDDRGTGTNSFY